MWWKYGGAGKSAWENSRAGAQLDPKGRRAAAGSMFRTPTGTTSEKERQGYGERRSLSKGRRVSGEEARAAWRRQGSGYAAVSPTAARGRAECGVRTPPADGLLPERYRHRTIRLEFCQTSTSRGLGRPTVTGPTHEKGKTKVTTTPPEYLVAKCGERVTAWPAAGRRTP
ncbi:hypothetical protein GOBAR_DD27822 [Gossypium barbadense]|nr:hypothetical protein GOBAR_DD27822 [Gossypium barbadense]